MSACDWNGFLSSVCMCVYTVYILVDSSVFLLTDGWLIVVFIGTCLCHSFCLCFCSP